MAKLFQLGEPVARRPRKSLSVPLTQHHLACIVGCSRQVLNAFLQELIKKGIFKIGKRRIRVLKPRKLIDNSYAEPV